MVLLSSSQDSLQLFQDNLQVTFPHNTQELIELGVVLQVPDRVLPRMLRFIPVEPLIMKVLDTLLVVLLQSWYQFLLNIMKVEDLLALRLALCLLVVIDIVDGLDLTLETMTVPAVTLVTMIDLVVTRVIDPVVTLVIVIVTDLLDATVVTLVTVTVIVTDLPEATVVLAHIPIHVLDPQIAIMTVVEEVEIMVGILVEGVVVILLLHLFIQLVMLPVTLFPRSIYHLDLVLIAPVLSPKRIVRNMFHPAILLVLVLIARHPPSRKIVRSKLLHITLLDLVLIHPRQSMREKRVPHHEQLVPLLPVASIQALIVVMYLKKHNEFLRSLVRVPLALYVTTMVARFLMMMDFRFVVFPLFVMGTVHQFDVLPQVVLLLDDDGRPLRAGPPIIPASRPGTVRPLPSEPSGRGSPSIIETVPPPRARTPRTPAFEDLALAEEQRDRLARLDEAEHRINDVVESARESEQQREAEFEEKERQREDEFRMSEQDRDRIFRENEEARAREAAEARDALLHDLGDLGHVPPSVPPAGGSIPGVVVDEPGDRSSIHTIQDIRDTASRHAQEIREIIDLEREENTKEREAAAAERLELEAERNAAIQAAQELKDARIQELEEQVAALRAELEAEKEARQADESDARERERAEREEHNEFIRSQLMDLTNLMNEQRQVMDEKKELMESRYAEKEERRRNKDAETAEMRDMIQRLFEEFQAERDRAETLRMEAEGKPGVEKILEDVMRRHDEIQEALRAFSDTWRNECEQHHAEIINAVRETANEQVPYNIQGYLDEFSKALASEVRILLGEVGKLREERRALQHEIGYLLCMRSKYGPGGEFEPDWKPPPGAPGGPPVEPPPPPEPPVPPEIPPARPGWRTVHQRSRKKKEKAPPPAPGPSVPAITGMVDPRTQVTRSWATWQPDPNLAPTPASIEPTLLVPDRDSPGLFGARSPRDSRA
ncbi:hypothetical protein LENED_001007 [Lentinula edodes]|uniref:Uncharacterized protein n=1 Tax=Lentinula edodes TaxID=5353 RepID=A0A1Q3DX14_LENED|nr:hypothetical protein LENED_001007 [Lentinula edodes]